MSGTGRGGWVGLRERVINPHTLCWLAWSLSLLWTGGQGRCRGG